MIASAAGVERVPIGLIVRLCRRPAVVTPRERAAITVSRIDARWQRPVASSRRVTLWKRHRERSHSDRFGALLEEFAFWTALWTGFPVAPTAARGEATRDVETKTGGRLRRRPPSHDRAEASRVPAPLDDPDLMLPFVRYGYQHWLEFEACEREWRWLDARGR